MLAHPGMEVAPAGSGGRRSPAIPRWPLHPPGGPSVGHLAPGRQLALGRRVASRGLWHVLWVEAQPQPAFPEPFGPADSSELVFHSVGEKGPQQNDMVAAGLMAV